MPDEFEIPDSLDFEEPEAAEPIIPDSIEPYLGYKALNIDSEGRLCSPSYAAIWPPKRAYEAVCAQVSDWGWAPVQGKPRSMDDTVQVPQRAAFAMTAVAVSSTTSLRTPTPRPRPNNPLPPGWSWSWEMLTHDAPAEDCTCGVYVAAEPNQCVSYMHRDNGIICEIALWGRVVPASSGARGQYAYPKRILAPRSLVASVKMTALLYDIPVLVLDPVESDTICTDPVCACVDTCRVTGKSLRAADQMKVAIQPAPLPAAPVPTLSEWVVSHLPRKARPW